MAEGGGLFDQDQFSCAICLDLLKDPVTIPCGHSFCMGCIKGCWDQDDLTGVYSCPQCRQTFTPRPDLRKNIMFAEVVEKLKKTELQAAPPAHCYAGPGDVACDVCTGRKHKAVKSCLVCLASYCETHLQPHYESPPLKKHKLVKATGNLQEKICSHHDKLLEVYCRTDQQCICYLCTMDEHRGHDTVSAAAERTKKQKQMGVTQREFQQRIQEREKELQDVRQTVQLLKRSAQAAVEDSERIFTELIRSIERRCSEVKELIRDQEKAEVSRAEGLLEQLEQEIAELRRRDAELEQLSHTEDHIHFLQSCQSLCAPPGPGDFPSIAVSPHGSFEAVRKSVSDLKEQLEDVCKKELVKISESVKEVHTVEPRTREDFLQNFCHLTLDPNTVNKYLSLSEGNRKVTRVRESQSYPDHPERFEHWPQVLCREGLSGHCYWEAEWSGDGVYIAVSYKEIRRKGEGHDSALGCNNKSWSLFCSPSIYYFYHNNKSTKIPVPCSSRIGVYLDYNSRFFIDKLCLFFSELSCDFSPQWKTSLLLSQEPERTSYNKQLGETQSKFQQRIQEREKELQDLRQAVQSIKRSAQTAVEDSERIFTELIRSIERRRSEVKKLIRDKEKAAVSRVERLLKRLEKEIAELRRRDAELEQLSHTEDHIRFLQSCQCFCAPPGPGEFPSITVSPQISFEALRKSVSELKERLKDICKEELVQICVTDIHIVERRTREDFLQHSCQLTLDPDTAHQCLRLSEGNRKVTCVKKRQPYPDHPERFECWSQVLCREGLSGRCYWEAEWSGDGVYIAVSYKEISRKGRGYDCGLGFNNKSWSLCRNAFDYTFWHNIESTKIPVPRSSRIGVYLDHRAGTLSFYRVSDTMTLLHRVQTTFTQPLYPGFAIGTGTSVKLCDLG